MVGYNGGHITRVSMKNFMTYEDVEIYPKSGLNLVVGLNGSGKSSLMSAICLGLAGKPQYTGRAARFSEFIKHGQKSAIIEVELDNPNGPDLVITTTITQDNKCVYKINNSAAQYNEVLETVKKFNIDMSNLCQFLPQERVTEFSKMNKSLRLENMLQAIGEPHLFSLFNDLKKLRKKFSEMEEDIKNLENKKTEAQQKNEKLMTEVDKQEEIRHLKSNLGMLQKHLAILEYSIIRNEFSKLKLQRKEQEAVKNRILEKENVVKKEENAVIIECEQLKTQINNMKKRAVSLQKDILAALKGLNECHEKVDCEKIEYRNKLAEKEDQNKVLRNLATQILGFQRVYDTESEKIPEIKSNIERLTSEYVAIDSRIKSDQSEVAKLKVEVDRYQFIIEKLSSKLLQRQTDMKNERYRKLCALRNMSKDTYEAVLWLEENRGLFKKPIFLPIFLEIKINDEDRKYIENYIRRRDLLAFICTDKEDNKTFTKLVRVEKKLNINIVLAPEESLSSFSTPELTPEHRKYGLQHMLKDLFTVPDAVMSFLCCCYNVHRIPVGTNICEDYLEKLIPSFPTFFTPSVKVSAVRSRYGAQNVSISKDQIINRNFLQSSKSEDIEEDEKELKQYEQLKTVLEQKYHKKNEELISIVREQDLKKEEMRELNKSLASIRNLLPKLTIKKQEYEKKASQIIDEEKEKERVTEKVRYFNQEKLKYLKQLQMLFKESLAVRKDIIKVTVKLIKELKKHDTIKIELQNIANDLRIADDKVKELKTAEKEVKQRGVIKAKEISQYQTNVYSFLPQTIPEVKEMIIQCETKLSIHGEEDESVLTEYNDRKKEISDTEGKIENYKKKLQELKSCMDEKKQQWLPAVQGHIRNINKKFSQYFKYLSCAGEINLDTAEDSDDFQSYGLQISLKYREDEPFTELSQTHHSGGECSVAAIIFILSLQDLTEVPFRCIDEINQGMDSVNERKVFNLISSSTKERGCSQYFLLTPKLLTDLQYHNGVSVHIIYNSRFLNTKLDVKKFLK